MGVLMAALIALSALGFGAHAALDWHRHGSPRAGFFHLHVHFGHHHHGESEHHGHEDPDPAAPSDDHRENGTLTLVLGAAPSPTAATAARPLLEDHGWFLPGTSRVTDRDLADRSWSPRGPPA